MAVEFISNGYDTTPTNPYTEGAWADAHPSIGLASYGVRSAADWKVTAVAGQDRTVSIAAGRGFGRGVTDKTVTNDTIQLDTISSGSRWDLIAVRRDWTPTAGVSSFVKVNGGATAVIPGGRQAAVGGIDDQPIALVQVTAGQTQPTSIIDLRTWSGDGGGVIAAHDLVRSYMNAVGTRLWINGIDWLRRAGANDTPEWVNVTAAPKIIPSLTSRVGPSLTADTFTAGLRTPIIHVGSKVVVTDDFGYFSVDYPQAFPSGLLAFIPSNGDSAQGRDTIVSAAGHPFAQSLATGFGSAVNSAGAPLVGKTLRIDYIAGGF